MTATSKVISLAAWLLVSIEVVQGFSRVGQLHSVSSPLAFEVRSQNNVNHQSRISSSPKIVLQASTNPVIKSDIFSRVRNMGSSRPSCNRSAAKMEKYSASDWIHNVFSIPQSSVLRDIRNPVFSLAAWGTLVSLVHNLLVNSARPSWNALARNICLSGSCHSLLVSSLGLLLVFRTNSAYQRFVEGRKIWEDILSVSRNLSRMMNLYENEVGRERRLRVQNLLAAFPYLLRHHVRPSCLKCSDILAKQIGQENLLMLREPEAAPSETRYESCRDQKYLTTKALDSNMDPKECWVDKRKFPWSLIPSSALEKCANTQNRPLWACDRMARELISIPYCDNYTSRERLTLIGQIDKLSNSIGACERIHQTAVPLNYARHSLRSLSLWLFTLPFAFVRDLGLLTGPVMAFTAWLLFGVYQIGYSIEDPFQGSLRLTNLCDAIRKDILDDSHVRETAFSLEDKRSKSDEVTTTNGIQNTADRYRVNDTLVDYLNIPKSVEDEILKAISANTPSTIMN